jgi:site-specific DNA-cytosine methylase
MNVLGRNIKVKLFSFFSGAGFLDLGFETQGFSIAFVNEYLPAFLNAYRHSRKSLKIAEPEHGYYGGSITDFSENTKISLKCTLFKGSVNWDQSGKASLFLYRFFDTL